jgi:hypothetical protein
MDDTRPVEANSQDLPPQERLTRLREMLVKRFSVEELRTLCFDLGLEYDGLPGDGKEAKARELVAYLERRDRIPELEEKSKRLRPDLESVRRESEQTPVAVKPPVSPRLPPTSQETINQQEAVDLFCDLMRPDSDLRVLRLLGGPKLGKTHLVTRVFPSIAHKEYHARCAVITMRNQAQDVADILHALCGYLDGLEVFPAYKVAYQDMQNRAGAQGSGAQAQFSRISMRVETGADDPRKMGRELVPPFVADLRKMSHTPIVLLFDAVNDASSIMQEWLMDTLVGQLSLLLHVRIVVTGRSVPEPSGGSVACCHSFELTPVKEEEAYITYCRRLGIPLVEQSIKDIARVLDYKPGQFVDFVLPKFPHREAAHV